MKKKCSHWAILALTIRTIPWMLRASFMVQALNRWYVFRDLPDFAVRMLRCMRHSDESGRAFGRSADEEWRLRKRRQIRELRYSKEEP